MFKEVVFKIVDVVGDGMIIVIVLVQVIVREGYKVIVIGINFMDLKWGIDVVVMNVVEYLYNLFCLCSDNKLICQVVIVFVNWNDDIGEIIVKVMECVGCDGVIIVEEGKLLYNEFEVVEGMQFDRGYLFLYFVMNIEKMQVELDNFYLLLVDKKVI